MRFDRLYKTNALVIGVIAVAAVGCGTSGSPTQAAPAMRPIRPATVLITAAGGDQVNPTTPIVVTAGNGTLSSVTVTNPHGNQVTGALSSDHVSWRTTEVLSYGADYDVSATAVGRDGRTVEQRATIHTLTPKRQVDPSVFPAPGPNVDVGVGQPIVVRFDQDITDHVAAERALQVVSVPDQPGGWGWVSDQEVHYRPQNFWRPGTRVTVNVKTYGVDLGAGVYGQADRTLDFTVHEPWVARADGNTKQMQIFHNNQLVNTLPISMGKENTPTHAGMHVISEKHEKVTMDSCTYGVCPGHPDYYRVDEYFAQRISDDGEYVHENPASVDAQGNTNVSHGCINLNQENAQWFFQHFGPGDVVDVVNSGGPPLSPTDTYGVWAASWPDWQTRSALRG
jgi:lipoprotein-anchoring transpeptidase ErfK/SrfK